MAWASSSLWKSMKSSWVWNRFACVSLPKKKTLHPVTFYAIQLSLQQIQLISKTERLLSKAQIASGEKNFL